MAIGCLISILLHSFRYRNLARTRLKKARAWAGARGRTFGLPRKAGAGKKRNGPYGDGPNGGPAEQKGEWNLSEEIWGPAKKDMV